MNASGMRRIVHVPIGGLACAKAPDVLTTLLGSCVGFIVQDMRARVCALAHVVRPSGSGASLGDGYFADRAAPLARDLVIRAGGNPRELVVRLAGGGRMFAGKSLDVGQQNQTALREATYALGMVFGGMLRGPNDGGCVLVAEPASGRARVRGLGEQDGSEDGWRRVLDELLDEGGA